MHCRACGTELFGELQRHRAEGITFWGAGSRPEGRGWGTVQSRFGIRDSTEEWKSGIKLYVQRTV